MGICSVKAYNQGREFGSYSKYDGKPAESERQGSYMVLKNLLWKLVAYSRM